MIDYLYSNYKDGTLDEQVKKLLSDLAEHESKPLREQRPDEVRKNSSILN
jgi:hypothetical protein